MTFCKEVRREKSICWNMRLPLENLNSYVHHIDEQKQHKLKEPFHKSYLYERFFCEKAMLNKVGFRRG